MVNFTHGMKQVASLTLQQLGARAGSSPGRTAAPASSRGKRGPTCRWGSCGPSPPPRQTPSCRRQTARASCPCVRWLRRTCTGRTSSPCPWLTTCWDCGSPGEENSHSGKEVTTGHNHLRLVMSWHFDFFTCRTSWLEAKMISLRAGGGILIPSLKAMDIMAPWEMKK